MDKRLLQACLGLRYLELMQDRTRRADYEDAARLRAECKWLERYLTARLRSEWVRTARNTSPMGLLPSPDELYAAVAARIVSDLNAATLAA